MSLIGRQMVTLAIVGMCGAIAIACSSGSSSHPSTTTTAPRNTTASGDSTSVVTKRAVVTIRMAMIGDPGNPSVGVVQTFGGPKGEFVDPPKNTGIYKNCGDAPAAPPPCLTVGRVNYTYGIGAFETTVSQYVAFLNTVDPRGRNSHNLYNDDMNPEIWPQYGSIRYSTNGGASEHYSVAYPEWANKPFNFGDFRRAARFVNSLTNGKILSTRHQPAHGFTYIFYTVRLSPETERGMYDMSQVTPIRAESSGFVIPSNNEWVKAAYYDPNHGGTDSYWKYPTGPFNPPNPSVLNPNTGDVTNAGHQPLATYNPNDPNSSLDTAGSPPGTAPDWCPSQAGASCDKVFPTDFPSGLDLPPLYMANVSTVGQTRTPSPWGTFDQGGNVVEVLDTTPPQPQGYHFIRDWRYYHGGVANAPAYQLAISAFGYAPGDPPVGRINPWTGFRVGVVGTVK